MCIIMHQMRTTIELTDDQRSELVRLAAKRRLKGFSMIIQEAVDEYLMRQGGKEQSIATALELKGCMEINEADDFEERVRRIREAWRCS
jgi:predicted transcriptional regulator